MAKKHALLIGTSQFNDHRLNPLSAPLKDINDLGELLKDKQFCGFDSVKSCLNSSLGEVRSSIDKLFSQRAKDDLLLLYYTGHGVIDKRGRLYFALPNSDPTSPSARSLDSAFIRQHMDDSNSSRQVLILDCCHSGAFGQNSKNLIGKDSGLTAINQSTFDPAGHGRFVLSSSAANERSFELDGQSIFTHTLINGVRKGVAAPNKDEILLDDLHDYLCKAVQETDAPMMPSYWAEKNAEPIIFSKNPKKVEPIDISIINALDSEDHFARIGAINNLQNIAINNKQQRQSAIDLLTKIEKNGGERSDVTRAATSALKEIKVSVKPLKPKQKLAPIAFSSSSNALEKVGTPAPITQSSHQSTENGHPPSLAKPAAIISALITFITLFLNSNNIELFSCFDLGLIDCGYLPVIALIFFFLAINNAALLFKLKLPLIKCVTNGALFFMTAFFLLFIFSSSYLLYSAALLPLTLGLIVLGCNAFSDYKNFRNIASLLAISIVLSLVIDILNFFISASIAAMLLTPAIAIVFYVFYRNVSRQH